MSSSISTLSFRAAFVLLLDPAEAPMVIGAELFLPEEEEFSRELPFLKTTVAVPLEKSNVKK